jgi:hypothetical protein
LFKKLLVALVATLAALGFANFVHADPGPNGNNDHGLCTAYFNGQKNGHGEGEDQSHQPPPFQGLEDASRTYTDNDGEDNDHDGQTDEPGENTSLTDAENIFNYCNDGMLIGGNPEHGRFTCTDPGVTGPSTDPQTDPECETNPAPGNS